MFLQFIGRVLNLHVRGHWFHPHTSLITSKKAKGIFHIFQVTTIGLAFSSRIIESEKRPPSKSFNRNRTTGSLKRFVINLGRCQLTLFFQEIDGSCSKFIEGILFSQEIHTGSFRKLRGDILFSQEILLNVFFMRFLTMSQEINRGSLRKLNILYMVVALRMQLHSSCRKLKCIV